MIPEIFLDEKTIRSMRAREKAHFEESVLPNAVDWDEDKTKFAQELCLNGKTYHTHKLFDVAPVPVGGTADPTKCVLSPCGRYLYANQTLPRGRPLSIAQGRREGRVYFTTNVHIPTLCEVDHHGGRPAVWMSMTPMEMLSQRKGVRLATGRVVVGGLGLGWFLTKVCKKPSVTSVTVVEQDRGLMDWLRPVLTTRFSELQKVKEWVVGDAVTHVGLHGQNTRYLLDIWKSYGRANSSEAFQAAKKRAKYVWGWGDVER